MGVIKFDLEAFSKLFEGISLAAEDLHPSRFNDPLIYAGVSIARRAAEGSEETLMLLKKMVELGLDQIKRGAHPVILQKEIGKGCELVLQELRKKAIPMASITEGPLLEIKVNESGHHPITLYQASILLTDQPLCSFQAVFPLTDQPLIIFAPSIEKDVISTLMFNRFQKITNIYAMAVTGKEILEKIKALTGATVISNLHTEITPNFLGSMATVILSKNKAIFFKKERLNQPAIQEEIIRHLELRLPNKRKVAGGIEVVLVACKALIQEREIVPYSTFKKNLIAACRATQETFLCPVLIDASLT